MHVDKQTKVRKIRDVRIPMRDGITLGGNLYLPETEGKYPGIFSFYPYLKDGWIGIDHEPHLLHFARQGYAVMQVDFRGTGTSEGRNPHPFDLQERRDGFDIVEWIASQPWCTGAVGIWGISYGGITSLSIASTQPPHLRAIIQVDGTFDNYEWLLRTHGCRGLLLADVDWGTRMAACNLLPPLFADSKGMWKGKWRERLSGSSPWFMNWHGKPPEPGFWTSRTIPLEDIKVPTFSISGWYDAYTAPAFRVFEKVKAPARVLIGPWKHVLPDMAPRWGIGGLHEMVRWWDRWLKDLPNDVDKEPPVAIFVQGSNKWRYEAEWPIARMTPTRLYLSSHGLASEPPRKLETYQYEYDSRVGLYSTGYNGHRLHLDIPTDQSADDHASLAFTGPILNESLEITGEPTLHIALTADTAELTLVVKLCIVDAQGQSRMISRGNINPARQDAHSEVKRLEADKVRQVSIPMHPTSTLVCAGERLRVCIAGADFPELWPTPNQYTMTIHSSQVGDCFIEVPVVPQSPVPSIEPKFQSPSTGVGLPQPQIAGSDEQFDILHRRLDSRSASFETRLVTRHLLDDGAVLRSSHWGKVSTDADRPGATNLRTETQYDLQRPSGAVTVRVQSLITHYEIRCDAEIKLDGGKFWEKVWHKQLDDWTAEK